MKSLNSMTQLAVVSLLGLVVLHMVQLGALFAQLELSPPIFVGPLIGTAIAIQAVAIPLILWRHKSRLWWVIAVVLTAIPGVGPQKLIIEPDALILSPMILIGTIFIAVLIAYAVTGGKVKEKGSQKAGTAVA